MQPYPLLTFSPELDEVTQDFLPDYTLFFGKNKVYKNAEPQIWSNVKNIFDAQISKFFNCS